MKDIKKILIEVIPHKKQRYDTWGDYFYDKRNKRWVIRVSKIKLPHKKHEFVYSFLVSIHELVELYLILKNKISEYEITKWDIEHSELDDPGNHPKAPYHKEHMIATKVEKYVAKMLNVDYKKYNEKGIAV